jgi:hypothetical protein
MREVADERRSVGDQRLVILQFNHNGKSVNLKESVVAIWGGAVDGAKAFRPESR